MALQNHPAVFKASRLQIVFLDPEIEHPAIAPHHSRIVVCIELQQHKYSITGKSGSGVSFTEVEWPKNLDFI